MKKIIAAAMSFIILFSGVSFRVSAEMPGEVPPSGISAPSGETEIIEDTGIKGYSEYLLKSELKGVAGTELLLTTEQITSDTPIVSAEGKEGALISEDVKTVVYTFTVETAGEYRISMNYLAKESRHTNIVFGFTLDGELPYNEAKTIHLNRAWKNEDDTIVSDSRGNHMRPDQIITEIWQENVPLYDVEGIFSQPLSLILTEGEHTIECTFTRSDLVIGQIRLAPIQAVQSYEEYHNSQPSSGAKTGETTIFEAEEAVLKSDPVLYPIYDRSDPATSPSHATLLKLNTIGGQSWQNAGQWIEWEIEAPADGWYTLSLRSRQNLAFGSTSYRRLMIDGEVPFREAENIPFPYSSEWTTTTIGGNEEPYEFYLEQGPHTIRLQVVSGPLSDAYSSLKESVTRLNELYRQIIMITGTTPDSYRDYQIHKDIPRLLDDLTNIRSVIQTAKDDISSIGGADNQGVLQTMILQLDGLIERPSTIPFRLAGFTTNIASLSAWLLTLRQQPLELDTIILTPAESEIPVRSSNIFEQFWFQLQAVIGSFFSDYQMVGDFEQTAEAIDVWIMLGRDQAQAVKDMVDNSFIPETGIRCNISLVQAGLLEATLARRGPDIALFVGATMPVTLAARGALVDLSTFDEYQEVIKRFSPSSLVSYYHEGGVYGLPLTQGFPMMFVRNDIMEELQLEVPQTWDDLLKASATLQRLNLQIGLGTDLGTFATLLYQKGGAFYDDKCMSTRFDEEVALEAFTQWTDFFTKYSFPLTYDLTTRFRSGEMPLALSSYSFYNTLEALAPELRGLWSMVPIPGTMDENGQINRAACGGSAGSGVIILKTDANMEHCWRFVEWFTRDEMQVDYGLTIEMMMGPSARYGTANINALRYMPWENEQIEALEEQWKSVIELPEIPAGYYISRNISNAFRGVINNNTNARQVLNQYNYEMNKEIIRKREEFGLPVE
ncbi:MAG: extracellular solute-binding protein [Oscillospiraceae bacterium]|nr:extracellular solute-binding protein [Oscillospiraceae bacterium]